MLKILSDLKDIAEVTKSDVPIFGKLKDNFSEKIVPAYERIKEIREIKNNSPYSKGINGNIRSVKELEVYMDIGLEERTINDKQSLILKDIDPDIKKDEFGRTNLERIKNGLAPFNHEGEKIELHHIGQEQDSPLAELPAKLHDKDTSILHDFEKSRIDRLDFDSERQRYWKKRAEDFIQEI